MCSLQGCVLNPLLLAFTPMTAPRAIPVTPSSNFKWHHGHCTHQQKGMSLPTEKKSWKCQPEVQQTTSHWREKKSSLTSGRTAKPRPLATSIAIIWRGFKPSNSWVPSPPLTYPGLWPQRSLHRHSSDFTSWVLRKNKVGWKLLVTLYCWHIASQCDTGAALRQRRGSVWSSTHQQFLACAISQKNAILP